MMLEDVKEAILKGETLPMDDIVLMISELSSYYDVQSHNKWLSSDLIESERCSAKGEVLDLVLELLSLRRVKRC